jgi:D-tyrosyl-tRNA(Tyr) deacylase
VRAVVQRVAEASVRVDGAVVAGIGRGLLVLLGVGRGDTQKDAEALADKVANLRIFADAVGHLNLSVLEAGGQALVVSQFTLYGDARKGRRPSFVDAAPPEEANRLYGVFSARLRAAGVSVEQGAFRAVMDVALVNHGPVTILLDTAKTF